MRETGQWDFGKMDDIVAKYAEAQVGCPYAFTYTFDEIRDLLGDKFCITDIHKDHIFKYKIEQYKNNVYEVEDCFSNMSTDSFKKMERELGWHTLVVATKI